LRLPCSDFGPVDFAAFWRLIAARCSAVRVMAGLGVTVCRI
jgi:hypothetical protein